MPRNPIKLKILTRIRRSSASVFLRKDFSDLGNYEQVGRALMKLVSERKIVRLGYGIYAQARISQRTGQPIPVKPIPTVIREALAKIRVRTTETAMEREAQAGRTMQVPTGMSIGLARGERCRRKLGFNGRFATFETQS